MKATQRSLTKLAEAKMSNYRKANREDKEDYRSWFLEHNLVINSAGSELREYMTSKIALLNIGGKINHTVATDGIFFRVAADTNAKEELLY